MSTSYLVDTNIIVRLLAGETSPQQLAAEKLFERAGTGEIALDVPALIVAEAFYVLTSYYGIGRGLAASSLASLLRQPGVKPRDSRAVLEALQLLQTKNIDFADAYLVCLSLEEQISVASFDRDLEKLGADRYEPKA